MTPSFMGEYSQSFLKHVLEKIVKLLNGYDNEYASFIGVYFYEYFHLALALQTLFRHPVQHFRYVFMLLFN